MLEYILFSERIRNMFTSWLQSNNIEFQLAGNEEEFLVLIDEDIDDSIEEKIEAQYDFLLDKNAKTVDEKDDSPGSIHLVGIQFSNKDGVIGQVQIPPELANQIQQCLSAEELQGFVQLIADEAINPKNKSLCQSS